MRRTWMLTAAAALALAACGSDDGDTADEPATDTAPAETTAAAETTAPAGTTTGDEAPAGDATVAVAIHPDIGEHLVDGDGITLYGFALDDGTTTACTGGCADLWPPIVAADPVPGDGVDAAELATADGIEANQVTYHDQLLYYYAGDNEPGDVTGIEIADWYAVAPDGTPIEASAAETGAGGPLDY